MAYSLGDYIGRVGILVTDKSKMTNIDNTEIGVALDQAIKRHSYAVGLTKVVAVTSDGGRLYDLPSGWIERVSEGGYRVEYPVDDEAERVQILDRAMTEIYQTPTAKKLRFRSTGLASYLPADGEIFRVHFPILYTLTTASNTVPDADFDAVCNLAASKFCLIMATRFAQQAGSTGRGDTADYRNKGNDFITLSKEFYAEYAREILPKEEDLQAAFSFGEFIETPLNEDIETLYPRDSQGRVVNW